MDNSLKQFIQRLAQTIKSTSAKIKKQVAHANSVFQDADTVQRVTWIVAALLIIGSVTFAVVDGVNRSGSSTDKVSVGTTQDQQAEIDRKRLITGQAESIDGRIRLTIGVNKQHQFKEIWANYSDDVSELEQKAGTIVESVVLEDREKYESHQVEIPQDNIQNGRRYYYQAVGRTSDDQLHYGPIATFDTSP